MNYDNEPDELKELLKQINEETMKAIKDVYEADMHNVYDKELDKVLLNELLSEFKDKDLDKD